MSILRSVFLSFLIALGGIALTACTSTKSEIGSKDNPIKLFFVPSVDTKTLSEQGEIVQKFLEANTPYKFKVSIPASYIAVVEAFGTKRADIAALNTFGYVLANEKYGAEARLVVIRYGQSTYRAQIIARTNGPVKKLSDINGKKVAYVDPASTSGYLLPLKLFHDNNVKPAETVFAQKHDNVVTMVYQGQVDAGATFYSPPEGSEIQDARRLVKSQYPDVEQKIKIVEMTSEISNDPIVFRKDLPEEVKTKVADAFIKFIASEEGKKSFTALYGVTDMKPTTDAEYNEVRSMLKALGQTANDLMKK